MTTEETTGRAWAGRSAGPGALSARLARARRRLVPAGLVALTGILAVLGSMVPGVLLEFTEFSASPQPAQVLTGRAVLLELGVLLIAIARQLARGSRSAWTAAVLTGAAIVVVELLRGRLGLVTVPALLSLLALLATRSAFRLGFGPGRRLRRLLVPLGLFISVLVYALLAYAELDPLRAEGFGSRLSQVARTGLGAPGGIDVEQTVVEAYVWSLRIGLTAVVVAGLWALRRPSPLQGADDPRTAVEWARSHGRSSAAPLIALPDNGRLLLRDGRALAGIAVRNGTAISLGLPVTADGKEAEALAELVSACETAGWTPALLALDERQRAIAAAAGFATVKIGEEAFLDVAGFDTGGKRRSNVRHSVTRARRDGVTVLRYDDVARSPRRDSQLAAISAAWLSSKGGPELGFTLGRFDLDRLDEQEVYAAVTGEKSPQEQVVGFVTWLPYDGGAAAVLDLMRRGDPCPPGVMECLVVDSMADFARRGRRTASLGGVPLAATTPRTDRVQQLLGWLYEHGGSVYAAKGLFRFKDKLAPRWEPMYLAYPRTAELPRIAVATLQAFLPADAVRQLLAHPTSADRAQPRVG